MLPYILPPFVALFVLLLFFDIRLNSAKDRIKEQNGMVDIYKEQEKKAIELVESQNLKEEQEENNEMTFTALGEIMMGGKVKKSDSGSYTGAFSEIAEYTKNTDYVVANFTTNITNLDKIEYPKTKYIVTKKVLNALNALNVNGLNISNDHALDFGTNAFSTTKKILLNEEIDILGLDDEIIYAEADGIRVAFIGVCNEVIGMQYYYSKSGVYMYNLEKNKARIEEAKTKADAVVVMGHLGLENSHRVTSIMKWYYKKLIDYGADIVLGAHALGIYPIEIYKDKPIIYSLGYFIHDTNYELGKESAIFNFTLDVEGNLKKINIIPTYIENKEKTVLYYDYNKVKAEALLNKIGKNIPRDEKKIEKNQLTITFK